MGGPKRWRVHPSSRDGAGGGGGFFDHAGDRKTGVAGDAPPGAQCVVVSVPPCARHRIALDESNGSPARTQAHSSGADGCASAAGVGSDAWVEGALARWPEGTGMRLSEGLSLRVKALKVATGGTASPLNALSTVPT